MFIGDEMLATGEIMFTMERDPELSYSYAMDWSVRIQSGVVELYYDSVIDPVYKTGHVFSAFESVYSVLMVSVHDEIESTIFGVVDVLFIDE